MTLEDRAKLIGLIKQGLAARGYNPLIDASLWGLLLSNIFSMVLAWKQGWDCGEVLWTYWSQSVSIGIANFIRMRTLKNFSTDGCGMNSAQVPETPRGRNQMAHFFAIHYGIFHAGYAFFLWHMKPLNLIPGAAAGGMALAIIGFAAAHFFSLAKNAGNDFRDKKPNLGAVMMYPYVRILPMHLTIIFGSFLGNAALVIFMPLKTIADLTMHVIERVMFRGPDAAIGETGNTTI